MYTCFRCLDSIFFWKILQNPMNEEKCRLFQETLKYEEMGFFSPTVKTVYAKGRKCFFCRTFSAEGTFWMCLSVSVSPQSRGMLRAEETTFDCSYMDTNPLHSGLSAWQGFKLEFILTATELSTFEWRLTYRALGFTDTPSYVYIVLWVFQL